MMQRAGVILLLIAACAAGLFATPDSTVSKVQTTPSSVEITDSIAKAAASVKAAGTIKDEEDFLSEDVPDTAKPKNIVPPVIADTSAKHTAPSVVVTDTSGNTKPATTPASTDSSSHYKSSYTRSVVDTAKAGATVPDSVSKTKQSVKAAGTISDEEEFLTEESEEKLKPKKPVVKPLTVDSLSNADSTARRASGDSAHIIVPVIASDSTVHDSAVIEVRPLVAEKAPVTAVEDVRSINFAKNQKEYRSPKLAMFMSLLIPGSGQVYTKNYIKAGIFVLAEVACITYGISYTQKGKNAYNNAKTYGDSHYSHSKFDTYYKGLKDWFSSLGNDPDTGLITTIYDTATYNAFYNESRSKSSNWYQDLTTNLFVQGWDDCVPTLTQIQSKTGDNGTDTVSPVTTDHGYTYKITNDSSSFFQVNQIDSATGAVLGKGLYGYSENQQTYNAMRKKSSSYYSTASAIFMGILVNHVISAVDALISAKAYNTALLGRETLWQHIHLESQMVQTSTSVIPSPGITLKVAF